MIDFEIPAETKAIRAKVRAFVQDECVPAEEKCTAENFESVLAELRTKARAEGLWCPFIPPERKEQGRNDDGPSKVDETKAALFTPTLPRGTGEK